MSERIKAGEAYVLVSCDNTELKKGLQEVSQSVGEAAREISAKEKELSPKIKIDAEPIRKAIDDALTKAQNAAQKGAGFLRNFVVTAGDAARAISTAINFISDAIGRTGDMFDKASKRVGASSATLSEYAYAAQMCGASFNDVEGAFKKFSKVVAGASQGATEAKTALATVGLTVEDLKGLSPDEQFEKLAGAVASISDPTLKAAAAMKIFGANGTSLLPLFDEGAEGIENLRAEARRLGVSVDDASAKMGADYVDATTRAKEAARGFGLTLGAMLAPAATATLNSLSAVIAKISDFVRNNRALVEVVAFTAASITAGAYAKTMYAAAVAKLIPLLKTLALALKSVSAAALANPYLTLAAAIGAVALAYYNMKKAKQAANDVPTSTKASEAYETNESARQSDRDDLKTLENLRKKQELQKLSNDEILQAVSIVAKLKSKYGDVGIEVDAVTGKITEASDAQRKLNQQMLESRKKELDAAIAEKEHNLQGDRIERDMADEEVSDLEMKTTIFRRRGESWGSALTTSAPAYKDDKDKKKYILSLDEEFQTKVKDRIAKERAELEKLKAERDALANFKEPDDASPTTNLTQGDVQSALGSAREFFKREADALKSEVEKQCDDIDEERDRLIKSLHDLMDPEGKIDWNNQRQVNQLLKNSPAAKQLLEQEWDIRDSAEVQKQNVRDKAQKAEDEKRRAESKANLEKAGREFESAAPVEEQGDKFANRINKINETFDKYLKQIDAALAASPDDADLKARRDAAIKRRDEAVGDVQKEQKAEEDRKSDKLNDTVRDMVSRFGSTAEKFAVAQEGLQNAYQALLDAQQSGDKDKIADALAKLGDAQDRYDSLADAQQSIAQGMKSVGGSFNAWQAASLTTRASAEKKLYDETRRQTQYLAEIARKTGTAVFV